MSTASNYHALALYFFSLLDPTIRFLFIPWGVRFVSLSITGSWAKSVNFYGLLCSCMLLGRIVGFNFDIFYQKHASFNLVLLVPFVRNQIISIVLCYLAILAFNRYSVIMFSFVFIGMISGRISSLVCSKKALKSIMTSTPSAATTTISPTQVPFNSNREGGSSSFEIDVETYDRMNAFVLIFISLYSGFLYDDRPSAFFPAFYPVIFIFAACIVVLIMFYLAKNKTNSNISKTSLKDIFPVKQQKGVMTKLERVELPPRSFIEVCKGDVGKATVMFTKTLTWRSENAVDDIFRYPQRNFYEIIEFYPHAIHGCAIDGSRVVYEVLGKSKPRELLNRGISPQHLVQHFMLRNEFIFHRFHKSRVDLPFDPSSQSMVARDLLDSTSLTEPCVQIMTVLDVKDIRVSDVTTDVISFIKQSSDLIDNYYPGRVVRLVVCNAPTWFWSVWTMISRVLPESVRKKIVILNDVAGLEPIISASQRPVAYGGTSSDLGTSPEHLEFISIGERWKSNAIVQASEPVVQRKEKADEDKKISKSSSFSWLTGHFQSSNKAYLGDTNRFHFDPETGSWSLDAAFEEESRALLSTAKLEQATDEKSMNSEQLEEHMMVLAIQAAHLASSGLIKNKESKDSYDGSDFSDLESNDGDKSENPRFKISAHMFLLVTGAHFITCSMQTGLIAILPVWFTTSISAGGLSYSPSECGLCISFVAFLLFHINIFFRQRLIFILRTSPLRSLRIGVGVCAIVCIFLHILNKMISTSQTSSGGGNPHVTLISMTLTGLMTAVALCFAKFSRLSSNTVMQIALEPSFSSHTIIIAAVTNLADILGPVLFAAVFSNCYRMGHKYPLDVSFFLTLVACMSFLVYLGTLLLNMNFKGDFGIITDVTIRRSRTRNHSNAKFENLLDIMHIPVDDITLLMVPSVSGYSSRLSHMNMKEG